MFRLSFTMFPALKGVEALVPESDLLNRGTGIVMVSATEVYADFSVF